jgi:SAM-dependent methyltransferase
VVVSSSEVIWHDLECGAYRADLPLWLELAERSALDGSSARILDVGAGTGRVALELSEAGHRVTALDREAALLGALGERAAGAELELVRADARTFELDRYDFDACLMPMQTVQLLDDSVERIAFLRRAQAHLRPGGLLAVAIVTSFEQFDCSDGDLGPAPERARVDGVLYTSRATRVCVLETSVVIERERRIGGEQAVERDVIELQRVGVGELEREAAEAGLRAEPARELSPTADHVGSTVVVLRA